MKIATVNHTRRVNRGGASNCEEINLTARLDDGDDPAAVIEEMQRLTWQSLCNAPKIEREGYVRPRPDPAKHAPEVTE